MNKEIMRSVGFGYAVEMVEGGICLFCGVDIDPDEFRDESSFEEWMISGLCQDCQDDLFGV